MSRAAGTLITTHQATYIPPHHMPGYRGHVPTIKFAYGDTFGNETAKYFQDYRNDAMRSSKIIYNKGGNFPTQFSHNPDLVISQRARDRDAFLYEPKYQMYNVDYDREKEIKGYYRAAQAHRDFYKDSTSEVQPVKHFEVPPTGPKLD
ncbi:ciliary microtubule inner protein 2C-like [Convolutriloba macropyga]|uniref:ciliary microtubule inner protein 2C-like n=1 Tax=Convolutriloba macropyga TaxID=536237 RepID=UPI003F51BBAC